VHRDEFLTDLENMVLQLVQRVMNLETKVKSAIDQCRKKIMDSNKHITMPSYENLLNAKKYYIRKLVRSVKYQGPQVQPYQTHLVLKLNDKWLYKLQLQQKLKITSDTVRYCLFYVIQSPRKYP